MTTKDIDRPSKELVEELYGISSATVSGELRNYLKRVSRHCLRNQRRAHASCNRPR